MCIDTWDCSCSPFSNPNTCLHGCLEPGVLCPYRHVLQRGGRRAPTHHTVTCLLHYTWSEGSFLTSSGRRRSQLRRRHSQDQSHGTAARAERRRRDAFFPSMINTVRSSADVRKPRQMCFSRTLCETCVADSLRPANMRYLQVGQRVGVARYMCAV